MSLWSRLSLALTITTFGAIIVKSDGWSGGGFGDFRWRVGGVWGCSGRGGGVCDVGRCDGYFHVGLC